MASLVFFLDDIVKDIGLGQIEENIGKYRACKNIAQYREYRAPGRPAYISQPWADPGIFKKGDTLLS